ncbi:MAG: polyprenyl synthetase family protein [Chloroflexi bacterium]|nr:polyprenyl synthetase family protein [Chloroflexota bacterium]
MKTSLTFYAPITQELAQVEENLKSLCRAGYPPLAGVLDYALQAPGKLVRPTVSLLSAKFQPGDLSRPILLATAVELLHIATLIHDDTVDHAAVRRGRETVSHLWGPQMAVLVGDYLFAGSAVFVCDTENVRVIRRFSQTIMELSTGELMERLTAFDWARARELYWDRIAYKTASLFCTATEAGSVLSDAPEERNQALKQFGHNLGMAFQVVDDILDFEGVAEEVGKPVGHDLLEGTLTLPAILLLERYPQDNPIPKLFQQQDPEANLKRALEMVHNSSIIQDSYAKASDFLRKATDALAPLPDCAAKRCLLEVVDYVLARRK